MARALKVYGCTVIAKRDTKPRASNHRQVRMVVATTSQRAAADAMDIGTGDFRHFMFSPNPKHAYHALALANPGICYWTPDDYKPDGEWLPWNGQTEAAERRARHAVMAAEREVARAERATIRAAASKRRGETIAASELWAKRLWDEFGIDARGMGDVTWDGVTSRLEVLVPPEQLYGALSEVVGILRDVGMDDHPFRGPS